MHVDHLHGCQQRLVALIGVLRTGPFHRLLNIVGRQYTEADGNPVFATARRRHRGSPRRKHIRSAVYRRESPLPNKPSASYCPLAANLSAISGISKAPGTCTMVTLVIVAAMALESIQCAVEQFVRNKMIEPTHDDTDPQTLGRRFAVDDLGHNFQENRSPLMFSGFGFEIRSAYGRACFCLVRR